MRVHTTQGIAEDIFACSEATVPWRQDLLCPVIGHVLVGCVPSPAPENRRAARSVLQPVLVELGCATHAPGHDGQIGCRRFDDRR